MMDDLISRQAAIDILAIGEEFLKRVLDEVDVVGNEREKYEWGLGLIESYIADMKELPSAQPEQRWIPVTERLPEPLQEVLVTSTRGYVYTSRIVHGDFEYGGNVIAWMPLPEPWKEGEANETN